MDHQYPTVSKIPILDTGKFEQWQFRIQQYLQHEHYALWEVIEFGDSYKVPTNTDPDDTITKRDADQSGRTLRFSKYKTTKELWAAILKTFGGNEATKKRKKNILKQQYRNFKVEGTKTLEQTLNRLQVIVSQLQFMDVEVEKDDLNQKFLTSLALEWLMHNIVWKNRNDLDSMSLGDLYNHLKVYEAKVQKKSNSNSQDMAFISSLKNNNNEDGNTICITTSSTAFPTSSVNVATISQDTASAYIASQIKFEDINQIDEDDMEEMDIKWNMALLSMRADKAPRSQEKGRKESYRQESKAKEKSSKSLIAIDGVGWDWSYIANEEDHALVADGEAPTKFALMANIENKMLYAVLPPAADLYLSPKKDLSWTGLPEFVDDTVTNYSRPLPTVVSTSAEGQNKDSSTSEDVASPNLPKPFV
nr:hypothetical protein [Tanacetum cinerariifolium]